MTIVLLSSDLMTSSQLAGPAQQQGLSLQTSSSVGDLIEKCTGQAVALVVLDLTLPGLNCAEVIGSLRSGETPPGAIVAFGPHVHEQKLSAAREAGCDAVFSRGQFFSQAGDVFKTYAAQD